MASHVAFASHVPLCIKMLRINDLFCSCIDERSWVDVFDRSFWPYSFLRVATSDVFCFSVPNGRCGWTLKDWLDSQIRMGTCYYVHQQSMYLSRIGTERIGIEQYSHIHDINAWFLGGVYGPSSFIRPWPFLLYITFQPVWAKYSTGSSLPGVSWQRGYIVFPTGVFLPSVLFMGG